MSLSKNIQNTAVKIVNNPAILNHLSYLQNRWADEKRYEDWIDYETSMEEMFPIGDAKFIKATKRPFGFQIKIEGRDIQFRIKVKGKGSHCLIAALLN